MGKERKILTWIKIEKLKFPEKYILFENKEKNIFDLKIKEKYISNYLKYVVPNDLKRDVFQILNTHCGELKWNKYSWNVNIDVTFIVS